MTDLAYALPGGLAKLATKNRWEYAPHLCLIEDYMLRVAAGEEVRLLLSMPPRHGKSHFTSHMFPPWFLGRFPDRRALLVSYQADFAKSWGRKARDIIEEHGKSLFGIQIKDDVRASDDWEIAGHTGGMQTAGMNGSITGKGADLFIIDDPIKGRQEAMNSRILEDQWDWFGSDVYSRLEPGASMIIIATRWSTEDLIGRLVKDMKYHGGEHWDVISLPAYATDDDPLGRKVDEVLWPERWPREALERKRHRMTPYWWACTPAESPVLMSDWTQKPIAEIEVGDEVVGFERGVGTGKGRLLKSKIKKVFCYENAEVFELTMASGRKIRCTKDHKWYKTGGGYTRATRGSRLIQIDPFPDNDSISVQRRLDLAYMSGFLDGEGCLKRGGVFSVNQTYEGSNGPVCEQVDRVLDRLGWKYRKFEKENKNKKHKKQYTWYIHNANQVAAELLRYSEIGKKDQLIDWKFNNGGDYKKVKDQVVGIQFSSVEDVYALETETGNYVVWGFASSNSTHQQNPVPLGGSLIKPEWFQRYSSQPANPDQIVLSLDTAMKESEINDYTVIGVWAIFNNAYYLLEVIRDRFNFPRLEEVTRNVYAKYKPNSVLIEDKGSGTSLIQTLQANTTMAVVPIMPVTDKVIRMDGETMQFSSGLVFLPMPGDAPWLSDYEEELLSFPNSARKDQVDMTSQFLNWAREKSSGIKMF